MYVFSSSFDLLFILRYIVCVHLSIYNVIISLSGKFSLMNSTYQRFACPVSSKSLSLFFPAAMLLKTHYITSIFAKKIYSYIFTI